MGVERSVSPRSGHAKSKASKSEKTCLLCGTRGRRIYKGLRDPLRNIAGTWDFRRCTSSACGFVWLEPKPSRSELSRAYANYHTHRVGWEGGLSAILARASARLRDVMALGTDLIADHSNRPALYLGQGKGQSLLEIGCGNGRTLLRMQALGWRVEGQEIDPKAITVARKVLPAPIHFGELSQLALSSSHYDAIVMDHVIEHVPDPLSLVAECNRLLKQNGRLVIITPNVDSYGHKLFGENWRGLEPPRHLHLFSQNTLRKMARESGFRTVKTWTSSANSLDSALASIHLRHNWTCDTSAHCPLWSKAIARLMAELYQMGMILRRRGDPTAGEECVLAAYP